jgi:hypothetical protein
MRRALALFLVLAACSDSPDGPSADAAPPGKRMFLTSANYDADLLSVGGAATGVESADVICNNHAAAIGLGGTWTAWISSTEVDAIDRITGDGPWYRMDGVMAFANKANLTTRPLVALTITEEGDTLMFPPDLINAWTGTAAGGRYSASTSATCNNWSSILVDGTVGDAGETDGGWTDFALLDCDLMGRLYCFED